MHILGLANGSIGGNSEIVLKAALVAAREADPTLTISWVHVPSIIVPRNPQPLKGTPDISMGTNATMYSGVVGVNSIDDRQSLLDAILDADGYIIATAVYSHSPVGHLKAVLDHILGPFTDVAFADEVVRKKNQGDTRFDHMKIDPRLFKPRVAGFMAVGGSTTPDQFTMALPMLHAVIYSLHVKIVDQVIFTGCGGPGSVLARQGGNFFKRATLLGKNVASQLGQKFDDAKYLGEEIEGACPYCHLAKVELLNSRQNEIGCVTCGARGHLSVGGDGNIRPVWRQDCDVSCITWAGKKKHIGDIQENGAAELNEVHKDADFVHKLKYWTELEIPIVSLPSQSEDQSLSS